jgi:hypothetical protein
MEYPMRSLFLAAALVVVSLSSGHAEDRMTPVSSLMESQVRSACHEVANQMSTDCAGYILGVFDQMSMSRLICPPPNPHDVAAQAVAVAVKFLDDHQASPDRAAILAVEESFKAAYPCESAH